MCNTEIVYDMPFDDYRDVEAANKSYISTFVSSCPQKAKHNKENQKDTPAMAFGRAFHEFILEPEVYASNFYEVPDGDGRSKFVKDIRAKAKSDNPGKKAIKYDEYEKLTNMKQAIHNHDVASKLLDNGRAEVSLFGELEGINCKCRCDFITIEGMIVDLKTAQDASPWGFMKAVKSFTYHVQAAMYMDLYQQVTGQKAQGFTFIAIEKEEPYCIGVYIIDQKGISLGRHIYKQGLEMYKYATENDSYAGYTESVSVIEF